MSRRCASMGRVNSYHRRDLLKLAGWAATGIGGVSLVACEADTDGLGITAIADAGAAQDAQATDLGEPDMVWLDAGASFDAGSPVDAGAAFVIAEGFNVILNDPSCSRHAHGIRVLAASYEDDTPVAYMGGSHEVLFHPSELMQLAAGIKLPFATVGDGPAHGHCGTAWAEFVGPADQSLVDLCETRGTAECLS